MYEGGVVVFLKFTSAQMFTTQTLPDPYPSGLGPSLHSVIWTHRTGERMADPDEMCPEPRGDTLAFDRFASPSGVFYLID